MNENIKLPLTSADMTETLLAQLRASSPQSFSEGRVDFSKAEAAITRLTEYRQAMITAAMTGKIDVNQYNIQEGMHHATVTLS